MYVYACTYTCTYVHALCVGYGRACHFVCLGMYGSGQYSRAHIQYCALHMHMQSHTYWQIHNEPAGST